MTSVINVTRYFYDADGCETFEKVWETVPGSYLLEGHPSNPKHGPYERSMTSKELRQWEMEHPEGVTTRYDPITHLPLV
jgi:hypothetical protein